MKKYWIAFASLILLISTMGHTANAAVYQPGEMIKYKVSFLGITLGYITVTSEGIQQYDGKTVYKSKGIMQSSKGIPFVYLKAIYESWMDPSLSYSHKFEGQVAQNKDHDYQKIVFDYTNNLMYNQKWLNDKQEFDRSQSIFRKYNDGLSLFFLAREFVSTQQKMTVPTIMQDDTVKTYIYYKNKIESVEIDAMPYKIRTIYFNGKADWTGIYGISGNFEGWFSDDDAHVPIRAKLKVYVGNVDIELIKWNRANWAPPKAG
jgi:hypothetical protein